MVEVQDVSNMKAISFKSRSLSELLRYAADYLRDNGVDCGMYYGESVTVEFIHDDIMEAGDYWTLTMVFSADASNVPEALDKYQEEE